MAPAEIAPEERIIRYLYSNIQVDGKKYKKGILKPRNIYRLTRKEDHVGAVSLQRLEHATLDQFKSHAQTYDKPSPSRTIRFVGHGLLVASEILGVGFNLNHDNEDEMPHAEIRVETYDDGTPLNPDVSVALHALTEKCRKYWDSRKNEPVPSCVDSAEWCGLTKDEML